MQGLGNDFVALDGVTQEINLDGNLVRSLADRKFGIGCDQVLLLEPPTDPQVDFLFRIFNADGNEVEQCGNGARCIAQFIHQRQLSGKDDLVVQTAGGNISLHLLDDQQVRVDMPKPVFNLSAAPTSAQPEAPLYRLTINKQTIECLVLNLGNPHAVVFVDDVKQAKVEQLGRAAQKACHFPDGVNLGFCQIIQPDRISLRVYERGVGETKACGTGACAAVAAGRQQGLLEASVRVELPGGTLSICWPDVDSPIEMTGEAVTVYKGVWDYE